MPAAFGDRVRDTSTTTGTGSLTLSGTAPTTYVAFDATFGHAGQTFYYCIINRSANEWEVGLGHLTAATTLSRDTVLASSTGAKVSLSAGTKDVFCTYPAGKALELDGSPTLTGDWTFNGITQANDFSSTSIDATSTNDAVAYNNGPLLSSGGFGVAKSVYFHGLMKEYNAVALVGRGIPSIVAVVDLTAQGAAISATTLYAVPAAGAGLYRISYVAAVTRAATTSSTLGGNNGFRVTYTDPADSVVKFTPVPLAPAAGTNQAYSPAGGNQSNATTATISGVWVVYAKASTNIQYQIDYTSSGATTMQYNLHISCEAL